MKVTTWGRPKNAQALRIPFLWAKVIPFNYSYIVLLLY